VLPPTIPHIRDEMCAFELRAARRLLSCPRALGAANGRMAASADRGVRQAAAPAEGRQLNCRPTDNQQQLEN